MIYYMFFLGDKFWHDIQHLFLCLKSTWLWYTLKFDGWNLILPFLLVASVGGQSPCSGVNPHVQAPHPYHFFCWSNMYPIISPRLPFPYKFWNDILIYSWFPEENPINHHFPRRFPQLFTPGRSAHPKTLWTSPRTSPSVWWLACGSRSFNLASLW